MIRIVRCCYNMLQPPTQSFFTSRDTFPYHHPATPEWCTGIQHVFYQQEHGTCWNQHVYSIRSNTAKWQQPATVSGLFLERWEWHVLIGRFWFSPAYYQYIQKTCMIWVYVDYEMKPIPYSISPVQQATAFSASPQRPVHLHFRAIAMPWEDPTEHVENLRYPAKTMVAG